MAHCTGVSNGIVSCHRILYDDYERTLIFSGSNVLLWLYITRLSNELGSVYYCKGSYQALDTNEAYLKNKCQKHNLMQEVVLGQAHLV